MYELELFAGAGGGILGKNLLGFHTVGAVEILPYCRKLLLERQREQCCPMFPIWDDVRTFSIANPECEKYIEYLRNISENLVISGGFPCQDISPCGTGAGITGKKSGLWSEMARIINEIRPKYAFMENSPFLTQRGFEFVLSDLAEMGYDAKWCVLGAGHLDYPIKRDRLWILGKYNVLDGIGHVTWEQQRGNPQISLWREEKCVTGQTSEVDRMLADGLLCRAPDGVADRVDRIKALGNGQVPDVVALAWQILSSDF